MKDKNITDKSSLLEAIYDGKDPYQLVNHEQDSLMDQNAFHSQSLNEMNDLRTSLKDKPLDHC